MIIKDNDKEVLFSTEISKYPSELEGSWFHITVLEDHPILLGIACVYFNNKNKSGTFVVSNKILNDYPDIYATWDIDHMANKMFVSPKIRKMGIGKTALTIGCQFLETIGVNVRYSYGDHKFGDFLFNGACNLGKTIEERHVDDSYMNEFRDPAYPLINFDKRFIAYED